MWVEQTGNRVEEVVRPERRGLAVADPRGFVKHCKDLGFYSE